MKTLKITGMTATTLLVFCSIALSQARVDSRSLTCEAASALVDQNGAVNFTTGGNTFERIVKAIRFCNKTERKRKYYIPTSDKKRCNAGFICLPPAGRAG